MQSGPEVYEIRKDMRFQALALDVAEVFQRRA